MIALKKQGTSGIEILLFIHKFRSRYKLDIDFVSIRALLTDPS